MLGDMLDAILLGGDLALRDRREILDLRHARLGPRCGSWMRGLRLRSRHAQLCLVLLLGMLSLVHRLAAWAPARSRRGRGAGRAAMGAGWIGFFTGIGCLPV